MPDLSAALPTPELVEAFLGVVDVEGKLLAALDDLGPVAGRDVVVLDAGWSNLEQQMTAALDARAAADETSLTKVQLVVNGVIGDPAFGEDSALYEAMGYVRKSERKSGLTRKGTEAKQ